MAMEAVAMIIRTGSLGDVEYAYSDLSSYGLPQQVYVTDTQVDVAYAYSDTSQYKLPETGVQAAGGAWQAAGAQPLLTGQKMPGTGSQSPLTGQKMPSVTQRQPVQQQSSGSMLLLAAAVGAGLFLALS